MEYTKTLLITETYDRQFDRYFHEALSLTDLGVTGSQARVRAGDQSLRRIRQSYWTSWPRRKMWRSKISNPIFS